MTHKQKKLNEYINTMANQDQCIGFIAGYESAEEVINKLKTLLGDLLSVADGIPYQEMFTSDIEKCEKVRTLLNNPDYDHQSI